MHQYNLAELSRLLQAREISSLELTRAYLQRIAAGNDALNCYITTSPETALAQAEAAGS